MGEPFLMVLQDCPAQLVHDPMFDDDDYDNDDDDDGDVDDDDNDDEVGGPFHRRRGIR